MFSRAFYGVGVCMTFEMEVQVQNMDKHLRKLHMASIQILETSGVKFHHPEILKTLDIHGIKIIGDTAYFKEEQLMKWVTKAPRRFILHARNPIYNMEIGGDLIEFAAAYGAPSIIDAVGSKRIALFSDYLKFLKLVHQCGHFNINGGILVQPADVEPDKSFPLMLYAALIYSDKCIMGGFGGKKQTEIVFDMLRLVFGDNDQLMEKPRIAAIISPSSPLQYDKKMLETLLLYAKYRQPLIITPATMAGTTGPVTLAGTIALSNAETLAGIAVTQMIREGTPIIYGSASSTADMKTASLAIGAPESALCVAFAARLAKAYGLPCRGSGTLNDAKFVSVQSGYESMMQLLVGCQEKVNFILHSAGIMDSYSAMSYEQFVVDIEIIGAVKRLINGLDINEETLALDVINSVGPGGEFITQRHTLEHCRQEPWQPEIGLRGACQDDPCEKLMSNINNKLNNLYNSYRYPALDVSIKDKLTSYVRDIGLEPDKIYQD